MNNGKHNEKKDAPPPPNSGLLTIAFLIVASLMWIGIDWGVATLTEKISGRAELGFDGQRALADIETQLAFGPRTPGSPGHAQMVDWLVAELEANGWTVEVQEDVMLGNPIRNVVAYRGSQPRADEWVVLGAHYDTRFVADQDGDPANQNLPVPGANDGGSGVAVLLELSRILPEDLPKNVWLVFFDAEDNGNIPGWDWILGSRSFVGYLQQNYDPLPDAAVIVDMIGDADLNIYLENNSTGWLRSEIWQTAAGLGYVDKFIPIPRFTMLDDHVPFLEAGIPAVDIIDFNYPYWHTVADDIDKVSAESLQVVGDTVLAWLLAGE